MDIIQKHSELIYIYRHPIFPYIEMCKKENYEQITTDLKFEQTIVKNDALANHILDIEYRNGKFEEAIISSLSINLRKTILKVNSDSKTANKIMKKVENIFNTVSPLTIERLIITTHSIIDFSVNIGIDSFISDKMLSVIPFFEKNEDILHRIYPSKISFKISYENSPEFTENAAFLSEKELHFEILKKSKDEIIMRSFIPLNTEKHIELLKILFD